MKFTDKFIKGLEAKDFAYRIFEKGGDKGFGVKITPAGSKSFFIQYATDGNNDFSIWDAIHPFHYLKHTINVG